MALEFSEQSGRLPAARSIVYKDTGITPLAHEEVVCHGHGFKLDHLLVNHRDAELQ